MAEIIVKNKSTNETTRKTTICSNLPQPNKVTKNAANAPPANQMVVNPIVASSIPSNTTTPISQYIASIPSPSFRFATAITKSNL